MKQREKKAPVRAAEMRPVRPNEGLSTVAATKRVEGTSTRAEMTMSRWALVPPSPLASCSPKMMGR